MLAFTMTILDHTIHSQKIWPKTGGFHVLFYFIFTLIKWILLKVYVKAWMAMNG